MICSLLFFSLFFGISGGRLRFFDVSPIRERRVGLIVIYFAKNKEKCQNAIAVCLAIGNPRKVERRTDCIIRA
jgi:hypothetical protein